MKYWLQSRLLFSGNSYFLLIASCFGLIACSQETPSKPITDSTNTLSTNALSISRTAIIEPSALSDYVRGISAEAENDLQSAFEYYQLAFKKDPALTELGQQIIQYFIRTKKPEQALPIIQRLIQQDPKNSSLYTQQGMIHIMLKKYDSAEKTLQQAITLNATNYHAYALLYQILEATKPTTKNLTIIQKQAPAPLSQKSDFWENIGETYAGLLTENETLQLTTAQIAEKALPFFEQALTFSPTNLPLLIRIAEMQTLITNHDQAIKLYQKANELSPNNEALMSRLATVYINANRKNEAIQIIETLLKQHSNRTSLMVALANLHGQQNNFKKMQNYLDLAEKKGASPRMLAEVASQNRHWALSENFLKKAIAQPGAEFNVWVQLAEALAEQNKLSEALATMKKAQERFPSTPEVFIVSSLIARQKKQTKQALFFLQQAEQIVTNSPKPSFPLDELYYQWAIFYEQTGNLPKAEEFFQKSITLNSKNHKAMNYLSYEWAEQGINLEQALELIKKALTHEPDNPAYLDTLGWIYYQQEKYDEALPLIQKAFESSNQDAEIGEHLGDIYLKLDRHQQALKTWKKAIQSDPKRESLRKKIKQLESNF